MDLLEARNKTIKKGTHYINQKYIKNFLKSYEIEYNKKSVLHIIIAEYINLLVFLYSEKNKKDP